MNEQLPHTDMVNDWIVGYLTNSLTPEEMQSLQNWLNVSEENREYFSDMQEVWIAASDEADEQHFDKERAYQLFLEHTESLVRPSLKRKAFTISPWIYVAAMVVIVFFCGTIAFQSGKRVLQNQLTQITVEAPYGSKTKLYLPDGTLVWLNAGSKMSYAQDFGINERSLNLSGEAYFEVTQDSLRPFLVEFEGACVKVLGTQFNVRAYPTGPSFTTLVSGCVKIVHKNQVLQLEPGQQCEVREEKMLLHNADLMTVLAWKNGEFIFKDVALETIMDELARWYDMQVDYETEDLKKMRFYLYVERSENLEEVLQKIALTNQVKYRVNGKKIIIQR